LSAGFTPISTTKFGNLKSVGTTSFSSALNRVLVFKSLRGYAQPLNVLITSSTSTGKYLPNTFQGYTPTCLFLPSVAATSRQSILNIYFPAYGVGGNPVSSSGTNNTTRLNASNNNIVVSGSDLTVNRTTWYVSGMWFRDLVNVIATGTYVGNATARAITLSGWTTAPSIIWIFSDQTSSTVNPLLVMSLGASTSITVNLPSNTTYTTSTSNNQIFTYSSSPNFGFQLAAASPHNQSGFTYYYLAFK
jgi:hypothetical protein